MRSYYSEDENYVFALVIYDVIDNRKRNKLFKCLKGYGNAIQKSAFEIKIQASKYKKMIRELNIYGSDGDSIRVYKIVGNSYVLDIGSGIREDSHNVKGNDFCII